LRKTDYFCLHIVGVTWAGSPKLTQGRNDARVTSTQDFQPLKPGLPQLTGGSRPHGSIIP
jgi:hypothetical protein